MFAHYAVIGMGHDTMHLGIHAHGLIDDNLSTEKEKEDGNKPMEDLDLLSKVITNDREVDEEDRNEDEDKDEDKDGEGSDSSGSDSSNSDPGACF